MFLLPRLDGGRRTTGIRRPSHKARGGRAALLARGCQSIKCAGEIDKRPLVLDPPKPREEHGNRLEAAYRATKEAN